jgi:transposase
MNQFSPQVCERSVRLVQENPEEDPSLWPAVESIAPKIGCMLRTLLEWVKRIEVGGGTRVGVTTIEAQR